MVLCVQKRERKEKGKTPKREQHRGEKRRKTAVAEKNKNKKNEANMRSGRRPSPEDKVCCLLVRSILCMYISLMDQHEDATRRPDGRQEDTKKVVVNLEWVYTIDACFGSSVDVAVSILCTRVEFIVLARLPTSREPIVGVGMHN